MDERKKNDGMLRKEGDRRTTEGRMKSQKHTFAGISPYRVGISIMNASYVLRMSGLMNGHSGSAGACIWRRSLGKVSFTLRQFGSDKGKVNGSKPGRDLETNWRKGSDAYKQQLGQKGCRG